MFQDQISWNKGTQKKRDVGRFLLNIYMFTLTKTTRSLAQWLVLSSSWNGGEGARRGFVFLDRLKDLQIFFVLVDIIQSENVGVFYKFHDGYFTLHLTENRIVLH
jgi:hypothetical protein